ncbi:OB-fold nucleic acid binding domain-containing protein [Propionibacteriaceae bacterium G57]|uniref:OB-fold nucleic acid binding domain-containing protein n=1 Tax=Aestuariimicrobium sp. G57 TaxID=3418485 RepID=UPI003DA74F75
MGSEVVGSRRPVGMWGRAVRRLTSSNDEFENAELADMARVSGCQTLADCGARTLVTLQGRIAMVKLSPRGQRSWLEADLQDGTGQVTLVWMGRRSIPGIDAGRMIRVSGRLVKQGRQVIYNPNYELLS